MDGQSEEAKGGAVATGGSQVSICFVIGLPRSGTTVFKKMLQTNPQISNMGEIFSEENGWSYFAYLREQAAQDPSVVNPSRSVANFMAYVALCCERSRKQSKKRASVAVLDVKYSQAHLLCEPWWNLESAPRLFSLIRENGWRVIDIRRYDMLGQIVSNRVAIETKIYHSTALAPGERSQARIRLDPKLLKNELNRARKSYQLVSRNFREYERYMSVRYEDMFDPNEDGKFSAAVTESVAGFLGVCNGFDREPKLTKVLGEDPLAHIENSDEVREVFARWEEEMGARGKAEFPRPVSGAFKCADNPKKSL